MKWTPERAGRWALFAVVAVVCFWRLGDAPLNETDEGFAANRAASFFRHDTFLVSFDDVDDDDPQFRKPPLLYWCVAICLKTLGWNLWAVRLPTALAGFGVCALIYLLTRRHVGELPAQLATLGFATVPFITWHIRTAMLEIPLLFLVLLAAYAFAHDRAATRGAIVAGLCVGGAILLKGGAGLLAALAAAGYGLVVRRPSRVWLRGVLAMAAFAALPLALYVMALPADWRHDFLFSGAVKEGSARLTSMSWQKRIDAFTIPLVLNTRWHVPAAAAGLLVLLAGIRRNRGWALWASLALLVSVPVVLIGMKQVVPYPRYFIPVYPFVIGLSALFCAAATRHRAAAWLMLPFAVASWASEPGPLRWTPCLAALMVWAKIIMGCVPGPRLRDTLAALLFAAVAWPSFQSAQVYGVRPKAIERPQPEVARLAARARTLVPEGEKVIVGEGFKCHTALFYSQRALSSFRAWLFGDYTPGVTRHGIFLDEPWRGVPGVQAEVIEQAGPWQLVRLQTDPARNDIRAIVLEHSRHAASVRAALQLLDVGFEDMERGFVVTRVAARAETVAPPASISLARSNDPSTATPVASDAAVLPLASGDVLEWAWPEALPLCRVELTPVKKAEIVANLRLEAWSDDAQAWAAIRSFGDQPDLKLDVAGDRLVDAEERAVRIRFAPVVTSRLRLVNEGGSGTRMGTAKVFVTGGALSATMAP
jgi:4-amino-4-deoxy-L-arabinose transferase-like glycosyltransferase